MRKIAVALTSSAVLAGCSEMTAPMGGYQPAYDNWSAVVDQTGITVENSVWLRGKVLNGIQSRGEADALVAANRGKQGAMVGYIRKVDVTGHRAAIEVIPVYSAENAMGCAGRGYKNPVGCLAQKRAVWRSAVTCYVSDLPALSAKVGRDIKADADARWQSRNNWSHVLVAGKISHVTTNKVLQANSFSSDGSFDGILGGTYLEGFDYSNIHIKNCRVATYRSKLVPST